MADCDVIIVGGGVGGSSLAANLARAGLDVLVLEREVTFSDRVRGEWITPWGTAECQRLDIHDALIAAGANPISRMVGYDELLAPTQAEGSAFVFKGNLPGLPAPLCMEHVAMQNTLLGLAIRCGARVLRGVGQVNVTPGRPPGVAYTHEGERHTARPRLVVGADGRSSTVRRQAQLALDEEPIDHLMSGLLVDEVHDWPTDTISLGKAGDVSYFVFPQGAGRARVYVDYDISQRGHYSGEAGARRLVEALLHPCLPGDQPFSTARPIGPCHAFPSQDSRLDSPCTDGILLIGDAASFTDPIWGQGLAVTFRDARMVRDLLLAHDDWSPGTFSPWVDERRERMRRLRWETRYATWMYGRFDQKSVSARASALERIANKPEFRGYIIAGMAGPDASPPEVFTQEYFDALFAC